jgi:hypothetical protein
MQSTTGYQSGSPSSNSSGEMMTRKQGFGETMVAPEYPSAKRTRLGYLCGVFSGALSGVGFGNLLTVVVMCGLVLSVYGGYMYGPQAVLELWEMTTDLVLDFKKGSTSTPVFLTGLCVLASVMGLMVRFLSGESEVQLNYMAPTASHLR